MERLFHDFYVQPMQQVYVETIALYLLWMFFMVLLKGRARNHLARTTALLGLALILLYRARLLRSRTAWVVSALLTAGAFVLRGRGWGHGVGLCQIGAAVMAARGHDYREILQHYYPGTDVE